MIRTIQQKQTTFIYRAFSAFLVFTFITSSIIPPQRAYAQVLPTSVLNLPAPGTMVLLSPAFNPPIIKGITIHPENPLLFDFIVHPGDDDLKGQELEDESTKLIKYFMASLTVPEDQMWVNLSPYEKDRIVPKALGETAMGRDLLAQDYLLKQLTASLMYPEDELGSGFWKRVYKKTYEKYGTTEIPMNTFNKIWIMPDTASIYEHGTSVFVVDSHLKVMLEEDYLALEVNKNRDTHGIGDHQITPIDTGIESEIIREILIPEIEKEVNTGKTFANLRQIYNSVILATWYKQNLKESLLGQVYVDQNKIKGIDIEDKDINQKIYNQYLEAFKVGVYNYIKEDYDPRTNEMIPRKYFSGGAHFRGIQHTNASTPPIAPFKRAHRARVELDPIIASSPIDPEGAATVKEDSFDDGAKKYAQDNTVIQKAPEFDDFDSFIKWYTTQTAQTLPSRTEEGEKISASYAMIVLSHAEKITGNIENFQIYADAYQIAIDGQSGISLGIKVIWEKQIGEGEHKTDLERLIEHFEYWYLLDDRIARVTKKRDEESLLSLSTADKNLILTFAYRLYGQYVIAGVKAIANSPDPYGGESHVYRLLEELELGYKIGKGFEESVDGNNRVLLIGAGRGNVAVQAALDYPHLEIIAINKEEGLFNDDVVIMHMIAEGYSYKDIIAARKRIDVRIVDVENHENVENVLGDQTFDFVIFERETLMHMEDEIGIVERFYNERLNRNGIIAFIFGLVTVPELQDDYDEIARNPMLGQDAIAFVWMARIRELIHQAFLGIGERRSTYSNLEITLYKAEEFFTYYKREDAPVHFPLILDRDKKTYIVDKAQLKKNAGKAASSPVDPEGEGDETIADNESALIETSKSKIISEAIDLLISNFENLDDPNVDDGNKIATFNHGYSWLGRSVVTLKRTFGKFLKAKQGLTVLDVSSQPVTFKISEGNLIPDETTYHFEYYLMKYAIEDGIDYQMDAGNVAFIEAYSILKELANELGLEVIFNIRKRTRLIHPSELYGSLSSRGFIEAQEETDIVIDRVGVRFKKARMNKKKELLGLAQLLHAHLIGLQSGSPSAIQLQQKRLDLQKEEEREKGLEQSQQQLVVDFPPAIKKARHLKAIDYVLGKLRGDKSIISFKSESSFEGSSRAGVLLWEHERQDGIDNLVTDDWEANTINTMYNEVLAVMRDIWRDLDLSIVRSKSFLWSDAFDPYRREADNSGMWAVGDLIAVHAMGVRFQQELAWGFIKGTKANIKNKWKNKRNRLEALREELIERLEEKKRQLFLTSVQVDIEFQWGDEQENRLVLTSVEDQESDHGAVTTVQFNERDEERLDGRHVISIVSEYTVDDGKIEKVIRLEVSPELFITLEILNVPRNFQTPKEVPSDEDLAEAFNVGLNWVKRLGTKVVPKIASIEEEVLIVESPVDANVRAIMSPDIAGTVERIAQLEKLGLNPAKKENGENEPASSPVLDIRKMMGKAISLVAPQTRFERNFIKDKGQEIRRVLGLDDEKIVSYSIIPARPGDIKVKRHKLSVKNSATGEVVSYEFWTKIPDLYYLHRYRREDGSPLTTEDVENLGRRHHELSQIAFEEDLTPDSTVTYLKGRPVFVSLHFDGETIYEKMKKGMTVRQVRNTAEALGRFHVLGLHHGNLSNAGNILVGDDDKVQIIDFESAYLNPEYNRDQYIEYIMLLSDYFGTRSGNGWPKIEEEELKEEFIDVYRSTLLERGIDISEFETASSPATAKAETASIELGDSNPETRKKAIIKLVALVGSKEGLRAVRKASDNIIGHLSSEDQNVRQDALSFIGHDDVFSHFRWSTLGHLYAVMSVWIDENPSYIEFVNSPRTARQAPNFMEEYVKSMLHGLSEQNSQNYIGTTRWIVEQLSQKEEAVPFLRRAVAAHVQGLTSFEAEFSIEVLRGLDKFDVGRKVLREVSEIVVENVAEGLRSGETGRNVPQDILTLFAQSDTLIEIMQENGITPSAIGYDESLSWQQVGRLAEAFSVVKNDITYSMEFSLGVKELFFRKILREVGDAGEDTNMKEVAQKWFEHLKRIEDMDRDEALPMVSVRIRVPVESPEEREKLREINTRFMRGVADSKAKAFEEEPNAPYYDLYLLPAFPSVVRMLIQELMNDPQMKTLQDGRMITVNYAQSINLGEYTASIYLAQFFVDIIREYLNPLVSQIEVEPRLTRTYEGKQGALTGRGVITVRDFKSDLSFFPLWQSRGVVLNEDTAPNLANIFGEEVEVLARLAALASSGESEGLAGFTESWQQWIDSFDDSRAQAGNEAVIVAVGKLQAFFRILQELKQLRELGWHDTERTEPAVGQIDDALQMESLRELGPALLEVAKVFGFTEKLLIGTTERVEDDGQREYWQERLAALESLINTSVVRERRTSLPDVRVQSTVDDYRASNNLDSLMWQLEAIEEVRRSLVEEAVTSLEPGEVIQRGRITAVLDMSGAKVSDMLFEMLEQHSGDLRRRAGIFMMLKIVNDRQGLVNYNKIHRVALDNRLGRKTVTLSPFDGNVMARVLDMAIELGEALTEDSIPFHLLKHIDPIGRKMTRTFLLMYYDGELESGSEKEAAFFRLFHVLQSDEYSIVPGLVDQVLEPDSRQPDRGEKYAADDRSEELMKLYRMIWTYGLDGQQVHEYLDSEAITDDNTSRIADWRSIGRRLGYTEDVQLRKELLKEVIAQVGESWKEHGLVRLMEMRHPGIIQEMEDDDGGDGGSSGSSPVNRDRGAPNSTQLANGDVGGIDLNPQAIEMDKRGVGVNFQLPAFDPAQFQNMNIEGFFPIIINISPITNIPLLLGLTETETEEEPTDLGFDSLGPLEKRDRFKVDEPEQLSLLN